MADGFTDIDCSINIEKLNGVDNSYTVDIYNYSETAVTRKVTYTKVIGGMIVPKTESGVSKEISFDFISNDLSFENLLNDSNSSGTLNYNPTVGSFEVNDTIKGDTSNATATITSIDTINDVLTVTNVTGTFISGETISETSPHTVAKGTLLSGLVQDSISSQSSWDNFDVFKISLLFNNSSEIHKRVFYNAYITEYNTKLNEGVLEGNIKFTLPLKNLNGDSNFYVYNSDTDNDSTMGW